MLATIEPITHTQREQDLARAISQALARLMNRHELVSLHAEEGDSAGEEENNLPANIARLFQSVLEQMGQGQAVVVLPVETELTTCENRPHRFTFLRRLSRQAFGIQASEVLRG